MPIARRRGSSRPWLIATLSLALVAATAIWGILELSPDATRPTAEGPEAGFDASLAGTSADNPPPRVKQFCGSCHRFPPPDAEPRFVWQQSIDMMYESLDPGWRQADAATREEAKAYYLKYSPEKFELPESARRLPLGHFPMKTHILRIPGLPPEPAVSFVEFVRLADDGPPQLLVSDMRHGVVALYDLTNLDQPPKILAKLRCPSHAEIIDLDGDGLRDILVGDLGIIIYKTDTHLGQVVWLKAKPNGEFDTIVLAGNMGRVNDVRAADFDGDGDLDLVVAEFGHSVTGRVLYFENFTTNWEEPDFEPFVVDGRPGSINVPIADLNQDGRPDFVALITQEHEQVVGYVNRGRGNFDKEIIYEAPHAKWGSTAIDMLDMDDDGDLDILYANGDAVEEPLITRPYHGVSWLENDGTFPYECHRITILPGVNAARAGDLDADGDLDIVAGAFMPYLTPDEFTRVYGALWIEQTAKCEFRPWVLKPNGPVHAYLDVSDYDGDGDADVAVGNFIIHKRTTDELDVWVTLLENLTVDERDSE